MKKILFALIITALFCGCAVERPEQPPLDDPLGRTLLIYDSGESSITPLFLYNSNEARFRRLVKIVARSSYAGVFDVRKSEPPPDARKYDTFLVGIKAAGGNEALKTFLSGFDFWDATVVPFWMGGIKDGGNKTELRAKIQGARLLINGPDFLYYNGVKQREIEFFAAEWMKEVRTELAARKAVGEYAEEVVKTFAAAFPDRIAEPEFRFSAVDGRGDWYFKFDGLPYAYASGRFLPLDEVSHSDDFRPLSVYRYRRQADDPEIEDKWDKLAAQVRSRRSGGAVSDRNRGSADPDAVRSPFYEALYSCRTRAEAYEQQKKIAFLGRSIQVHKAIAAPLAKVETQILELEKTDEEVSKWKKRLYSITSWNWRNVAGSSNRSYHSYGIAIDLLEIPQRGKETYWQWTRNKGVDWRAVTADRRLDPPHSVVCAFEEHGFIWGGTWPWYDTMHFEYRPELLILGS